MKPTLLALVALAFSILLGAPSRAGAQDAFIGEIRMFAGNFAPQGWAFCDGQLLPIAQNTALFSILGTNYGGNGTTNFALPDLRGRVPLHPGTGPGLTSRAIGEAGGDETILPAPTPPTPPTPNQPSKVKILTPTKPPFRANFVSGPPVSTPAATPATPDVEKDNLQPCKESFRPASEAIQCLDACAIREIGLTAFPACPQLRASLFFTP
jgi:hypothetical protein